MAKKITQKEQARRDLCVLFEVLKEYYKTNETNITVSSVLDRLLAYVAYDNVTFATRNYEKFMANGKWE